MKIVVVYQSWKRLGYEHESTSEEAAPPTEPLSGPLPGPLPLSLLALPLSHVPPILAQ